MALYKSMFFVPGPGLGPGPGPGLGPGPCPGPGPWSVPVLAGFLVGVL
jgi:hypothetical protein